MNAPQKTQQFASDNYSGICPEAMQCLCAANVGHERSYGDDRWTAEAADLFRELFQTTCEVFFVFNGTASNSLALASLCQSFHSIICHRYAHIETDECGAPEFFSHGAKLLPVDGENGKLDPSAVQALITKRCDIHFPRPKVISVTQATELGTVYSRGELLKMQGIAQAHNLKMHMDGARFANAVAALNVSPRDITVDCGIDVLCFGGTKNALGIGEAMIFFDLAAAEEFAYRCKQSGQLASKMRFLAAQWIGSLKNDTWLKYARHANECAALLERCLKEIPEVRIMFPREANSVFIELPVAVSEELRRRGWLFYSFIGVGGARFMCSWDTTPEAIHSLIADLKAAFAATAA